MLTFIRGEFRAAGPFSLVIMSLWLILYVFLVYVISSFLFNVALLVVVVAVGPYVLEMLVVREIVASEV